MPYPHEEPPATMGEHLLWFWHWVVDLVEDTTRPESPGVVIIDGILFAITVAILAFTGLPDFLALRFLVAVLATTFGVSLLGGLYYYAAAWVRRRRPPA